VEPKEKLREKTLNERSVLQYRLRRDRKAV
jgi:hypothetical protein